MEKILKQCRSWIKQHETLVLGQMLSILITCTGVFTQALMQNYGIQLPITQNVGNYLLLSISYFIHKAMGRSQGNVSSMELSIPWWKYALIALADVVANLVVVKAYEYTTIASTMLLDCFTIPCVMLLSSTILRAVYFPCHIWGVSCCLLGIVILVISDVLRENQDSHSNWNWNAFYGDMLCLIGSVIYACSNTGQEYAVKQNQPTEFLGMIGCFGLLYSSIASYTLEWNAVAAVEWTWPSLLLFAGYAFSMFTLYNLTAHFLKDGCATLLNLSLLTSDFFAALAGKFIFHNDLSGMYCVGFSSIILGLLIYRQAPSPTRGSCVDIEDKELGQEASPLLVQVSPQKERGTEKSTMSHRSN